MSIPVMSAGGNAGLFDLAENAALDDNRVMPSERTYPKSGSTVSINEAIALMKKRKTDPSLRIKGGLDDTTDAVRKGAKKTNVKPAAQPTKVEAAENASPEPPRAQEDTDAKHAKPHKGRMSNSELVAAMEGINNRITGLHKTIDSIYVDYKNSKAPSKEVASVDILREFKSSSHSVTFMLNGMEFTVKCLNMVKDTSLHTLVFVFPDDGDSFFTPPMQSELKVKYDGVEEEGQLYYFGMCFSIKKLGLKFLGFIYDNNSKQ